MKFICPTINLELTIDDALVQEIHDCASKHYPNEFGGILVGRYLDNNKLVSIHNIILPKEYTSSKYTFNRGGKGLRGVLKKYFSATPSLVYVGEWHTHPDGMPIPSATDFKAMREAVSHREVFIHNPILLIMSISQATYEIVFYVYYNDKMYRYEKV